MRIGDKLKLKIEKLILGGEGLAYQEKMVVFVPYTCPGDEVIVEVQEVKYNYARAKLLKVVHPSEEREAPQCKYFFRPKLEQFCGGCNWQHLKYAVQLNYKNRLVEETLKQLGGIDLNKIKINPPIPSPNIWRYRNKMQVPIGKQKSKVVAGFYAPQTHKIVDFHDCLLHSALLNRILQEFKQLLAVSAIPIYDDHTGQGLLRHLILRQSFAHNKVQLTFVLKDGRLAKIKPLSRKLAAKFPQIQGVFVNINPFKTNVILGKETIKVHGKEYLAERIGAMDYFISAESFFQINPGQTENLYNRIADFIPDKESVLWDVYCGCGIIGLHCAGLVKKVYGVEENKSAVSDAWNNARKNNIYNAQFFEGKAEKVLNRLFSGHQPAARSSIVILDPPRAGCAPQLLEMITQANPQRIIYVSCQPSTLARDIKFLQTKNYLLKEIQTVDMFPQTSHIECIAVLDPN